MRIKSRVDRKPTSRSDKDWAELRELRAIRKRKTAIFHSQNRKKRLRLLLESTDQRLKHIAFALATSMVDDHNIGDRLNHALAEVIFGYGAERFARYSGLNAQSLYRTFSLTERRMLRFETVDYVLRCLGMKLSVEKLSPNEIKCEERRRLKRVRNSD